MFKTIFNILLMGMFQFLVVLVEGLKATFTLEDVKYLDRIIARVLRQELMYRSIFPVRSDFNPNASSIEYNVYDIKGSAKIMAVGGNAKDIPFVGEEKTPRVSNVFNIVTGIKYTLGEIEAVAMARANGRDNYNLDSERPETARRFIAETENLLCYNGNALHSIIGILNAALYGVGLGTAADVANGAATTPQWSTKTPAEILIDIRTAISTSSSNGLFKEPVMLVTPYTQWFMLSAPYSDDSQFTLMDWIKRSVGSMLAGFEYDQSLINANTSLGYDVMLSFAKDKKYLYYSAVEEIRRLTPVKDILEDEEMAIRSRTAGLIVRHPSTLYKGQKI